MREGYSKLGWAVPLVLGVAYGAFAQDGTGRSDSVARPAPARAQVHRDPVRSSAAPPPIRRIELGKLALSVNEGESRVQITRLGEPVSTDVVPVTSRSSALIIRTLAAGDYRITVSKAGYADETREVSIADGRRQNLAIFLKPTMAFLTVAASVPDARIEIEKMGVYKASTNRILLLPGRYRVNVSRRGYVPQTFNVDLRSPGREENLRVLLKPLRVDDVLDEAVENVSGGSLEVAHDLALDVLKLNPAHARANLVYGIVEMRRGGPDAKEHLLKAVRNGETFRIPLKIQGSQSPNLYEADVSVDREGISIKSAGRFDLDFKILKRDLTDLRFDDGAIPPYLFLAGRSDFHGRPISPQLKLYPHDIAAEPVGSTTECVRSGCAREISEFAKFLAAWRSEK